MADILTDNMEVIVKNKSDKPCKHPRKARYYKYDPISHRQRLCCRNCGQIIISYR